MNHTKVSYFTLTAYFDTGHLKYLYFLIILVLFVFILSSNLLLIVVICVNRSLHEPMYMFLCSLFVNELYGSTGLFPFLLFQVLSDVHTVSVPLCFLQVFIIYSYAFTELTNLAVMSYDRYLSICYPLQYNTRMTPKKVAFLIGLIWFPSFLVTGVTIAPSASLQLCGNIIDKVYCDNYNIIKLSCSDTTVNNIYGLIVLSVLNCVSLSVIYSYLRILKVCLSGCKQSRQKAVSTCSPQLASLINYTVGVSFEVIQSRFDMSGVPNMLRIFLSLYFILCQPLFNPVVYGLKLPKIRSVCKRLLSSSIDQ